MTEESTTQSPVKLSIEKLAIVTKNGKNVPIDPSYVIAMNMYESITQPGITGDITFTDWQGAKESGEIFAGDVLEFGFSTEGADKSQSMFFTVYASSGDVPNVDGYNQTTYQFCSTWLVEALTRQVSKVYYNKRISAIVQDLLEECGVSHVEHIEPTKQILENFVAPLWNPIHTIKHLLSMATSEDGDQGGYVFWTDFDNEGIYCMPMHMIMEGTISLPDESSPYVTEAHNPYYKNLIHSHVVESDFDVVQMVNAGLGNTKIVGFDYDRLDFVTTDLKVGDYEHAHVSNRLPLNEDYVEDAYSSTHFSTLYPSNDVQVDHENKIKELVEGRMKNHYSLLFSDLIKMNLHVNADTMRRAGELIHLVFDVPDGMDSQHGSKMYTGTYVIRDIRHMISFGNYSQAITVCGDGYKEISRDDLVKWSNNVG
jgi:hypothetical protein